MGKHRTGRAELRDTRHMRIWCVGRLPPSREGALTVSLGVAVVVLLALYAPLNHGPARWSPKTPLDDEIPLVAPMVVPYLSIYPLAVLTAIALVARSPRLLNSALLAVVLTLLASYATYLAAQTYVARPSVDGSDMFSTLLRAVYARDQPYNAFPSLHVGLSTVSAIHWIWSGWRFRAVPAAWCGVIVGSTVFVHQHYLADLFGGFVVGSAASLLSRRVLWRDQGPVAASGGG